MSSETQRNTENENEVTLPSNIEQSYKQNSTPECNITKSQSIHGNENITKKLQQELDRHVADYVFNVPVPLDHIEDVNFKIMFSALNIDGLGLRIMNRPSLENYINNLYVKLRTHMRNQLKDAQHVSLTTDISHWVAHRSVEYFITRCHWIDLKLKRQSYIISARILNGYQIDYIKEPKDFQKNAACLKDLKKLVMNNISLDENDKKEQALESCILLAEDFTTSNKCKIETCLMHSLFWINSRYTSRIGLDNILDKCKKLWEGVEKAEFGNDIKNTLGRNILVPLSRFFWDRYDPLKDLLAIKDKIPQLCNVLKLNETFYEKDFDIINGYLKRFKPFVDGVRKLLNDKDRFFGLVLPFVIALRNKLRTYAGEDDDKNIHTNSKYILKEMEAEFHQYFHPSTDAGLYAAIAALSYPKFKDKWLNYIDAEYHNAIKTAFEDAIAVEMDTPKCNIEESFFEFEMGVENNEFDGKDNPARIMQDYLNDEGEEVSMLHRHVEVRRVFLKYNTMLAYTDFEIVLSKSNLFEQFCIIDKHDSNIFDKFATVKLNLEKLDEL